MKHTHTHTHSRTQKDARKEANIDSENRRRLKKWLTNFIRTQNGKFPKHIKGVEIVPKIATKLEYAPGGQNKRYIPVANPAEVRSSGEVHNAVLYLSARSDLRIRIRPWYLAELRS